MGFAPSVSFRESTLITTISILHENAASEGVKVCAEYLIHTLNQVPGFPHVVQALESDLLRGVLKIGATKRLRQRIPTIKADFPSRLSNFFQSFYLALQFIIPFFTTQKIVPRCCALGDQAQISTIRILTRMDQFLRFGQIALCGLGSLRNVQGSVSQSVR